MSGNSGTDIWIAGAFAAFTVDLLVYPLDTLKTRIQSPEYRKIYVNESTNTLKKAVLFRGLYQGLGSVVLATLPSSGAFFTTYEATKRLLSAPIPLLNASIPTPIAHSLASAISECVSCAILTPAEVIKQNAQMVSQADIAHTRASATRQTLRRFRSNPLALWRGYGALTSRNLPFTALQFPMFEKLKVFLSGVRGIENGRRGGQRVALWETGLVTATAAGTAGAVAAVVTTPVDVVKTRIMLAAATGFAKQDVGGKAVEAIKDGKVVDALGAVKESATAQGGSGQAKARGGSTSSMAIARSVVAEHGWTGLFRGGALRAVWTMLGSGLYLGMYESGRVYLARRGGRDPDEE